jgi:hypothetical protein
MVRGRAVHSGFEDLDLCSTMHPASGLMALWTSAMEVMIVTDIASSGPTPIYFAPVDTTAPTAPPIAVGGSQLPPGFTTNVRIFALTAFDPPGEQRSLEENTRRNCNLAAEIRELMPRPTMVYPPPHLSILKPGTNTENP